MIIFALLAAGLFLSAFFSGSETGFYRVTRVRLLMDAKSGHVVARALLWLVERPTVVVATVLIGNNIANYLVSLGLVLLSQEVFAGMGDSIRTFLPVLATPFLFIYGELLPKYLYYNAPYFLSTRGAPLMVLCAALFLPISILVIGLEKIWQRLFGSSETRSKLSLERQQLQRVMLEGQEAGILLPIQRELTQNLFTYGVRPIRQFAVPARAVPIVSDGTEAQQSIELAHRMKQQYVGVRDRSGKLIGCYSVADLVLFADVEEAAPLLPVSVVRKSDSTIHVLLKMQASSSPMAEIQDQKGTVVGMILRDRLTSLLVDE